MPPLLEGRGQWTHLEPVRCVCVCMGASVSQCAHARLFQACLHSLRAEVNGHIQSLSVAYVFVWVPVSVNVPTPASFKHASTP